MAKKYYWLKLRNDWFGDKRIKKLRSIAGGDTYTIIYLKMQLLSLKNEGKLFFEGVEDDFVSELALDLDEEVENVKITVSFLMKNGMLELNNTDEYLLTEVPETIGSETAGAERVRRFRNNKKALQCNRYKERTDPRIERKQNMAHDWLEYIGWCRELKYDLDNKFIYMPNNFKKVHDRVAEEYKALQDKKAAAEKLRREKLAAKRMEQTKKAMEEIFSKNDGVDAFQIKGNGLILVVPQSGDEIRKEGEALDHCVGGYVERVAKGETNIFFVRKADHPEQSYFTMEWKNNKVVQCRGKSNCGMPPDVKAFVQVFEKKMQDAIQKGDTNGKKKQNLQSA